jgi:hypothetical protein
MAGSRTLNTQQEEVLDNLSDEYPVLIHAYLLIPENLQPTVIQSIIDLQKESTSVIDESLYQSIFENFVHREEILKEFKTIMRSTEDGQVSSEAQALIRKKYLDQKEMKSSSGFISGTLEREYKITMDEISSKRLPQNPDIQNKLRNILKIFNDNKILNANVVKTLVSNHGFINDFAEFSGEEAKKIAINFQKLTEYKQVPEFVYRFLFRNPVDDGKYLVMHKSYEN